MVNKTLTLATVVLLALQLTGVIAVPWLVVMAPLLTLIVCTVIAAGTQVYLTRRVEKQLAKTMATMALGFDKPAGGDRMEGGYL